MKCPRFWGHFVFISSETCEVGQSAKSRKWDAPE